MAPKAPEKSPQQQPPPQAHRNETAPVPAVVPKHSNPFYISAHTLCNNKRLKQKRSKYQEILRNAAQRHKTEQRRQKLSLLRPEVTIDLLSDGEENDLVPNKKQQQIQSTAFQGKLCLERAAILGLMPVVRLTNGVSQQRSPPPLVPIVNGNNSSRQRKSAAIQKQNNVASKRHSLQLTHQPPPTPPTVQSTPLYPQQQQQQLLQQRQQQQLPQQTRKRKSRPHKRHSLPVLLNTESIVLSDDSDTEQSTPKQSPLISIRPDLAIIYPTNQSSPCQQTITMPVPVNSTPSNCTSLQNTIQIDEDVTISLVPRSLTAATCARASLNNSNNNNLSLPNTPLSTHSLQHQQQKQQTISPPFPMLPDETTVHTVIANRIYELSLTKLREGLASCGIPEFNDGQQKISPPRRKGAVQPPPVIMQPQTPISLKLSSDLSISLISDDEDEVRHHRTNEPLLSPAYLQKLPANVSIAPVVSIIPQTVTTTPSSVVAADPRKLKFG
ncbi:a6 [Haematobia irritans]|uniref:a6 n=1 Tax=Haematobia irritans TaxID=7368 RepID=UPI003F500104